VALRLLSHYSVSTLSNVYAIACERSRQAVLIDPARFEAPLLEFIEANDFTLTHVLITRPDESHEQGVRTLKRIYDAQIHAGIPEIAGSETAGAPDGTTISLGDQEITTIALPAHSQDARAYMCGHLLFCGPVISAGGIAPGHPGYSGVLLREMIHERLLSLPQATIVLPREGPPTTIGLERRTNPALSTTGNSRPADDDTPAEDLPTDHG
jgi:glyoxylase-like metal-dependent hydrolase (beta-lactamase superfamily II)